MPSPAPTFLFVHGSPGSARDWEPLLALAPAGARTVAIDLPDHGAAPDDASDDLTATIHALESAIASIDGPVVLVGHSFGAWLAAFASRRLAGRVERLVLIDGLPSLPKEAGDQFAQLGNALLAHAIGVADVVPIGIARWLPQPPPPELAARIERGLAAQTPERLGRSLVRLGRLAEPAYAVTKIDLPATFIHAEHDVAVPLALGLALAETARDKRVVVLPVEGHFPHWTHPELVAPHVFSP